jgi:hypothetical protein
VQFLRQLVAGDTVTEALTETRNRLTRILRLVGGAVVMVLRYAVLGVVFHPVRSVTLLRVWSDPANVTVGDSRFGRAWRAEMLQHDERLRARVLGVRVTANVRPRRRSLRDMLAESFGHRNAADAPNETTRMNRPEGVRQDQEPAVSHRPETPAGWHR